MNKMEIEEKKRKEIKEQAIRVSINGSLCPDDLKHIAL